MKGNPFNLETQLRYLDKSFDERIPDIVAPSNHNDGTDRPLLLKHIMDAMYEAKEAGWYHTSIWVTGSRTHDEFIKMMNIRPIIPSKAPTKITITIPKIMELYGRPLYINDVWVYSDSIPRIYLINFGEHGPVGYIIGDLM